MKVCHITSAHPRDDIRIFHKQCKTLASRHDVFLVVADGLGDQYLDGVAVIDVGKPSGRTGRMLKTVHKVKRRARQCSADVYHLHDPELLTVARWLKRKTRARVIFDAHEDVPLQLLDKHWIPRSWRATIARMYTVFERRVCTQIDAVVSVTPMICERYAAFTKKVVLVANFPMLKEFPEPAAGRNVEARSAVYIGGLSPNRGVKQMILAAARSNAVLHLAGSFVTPEFEAQVKAMPEWKTVVWHGTLSREAVVALLNRMAIGLVTLQPTRSYQEAYPIKMFEYMAAAVPVVASHFEFWELLVKDANCGLTVDPSSPVAIAKAMEFIFEHPKEGAQLGAHGRSAIVNRYNWEKERMKLLDLYQHFEQL
jgi:glycosyltransferase involved in cell wall biosynthesis